MYQYSITCSAGLELIFVHQVLVSAVPVAVADTGPQSQSLKTALIGPQSQSLSRKSLNTFQSLWQTQDLRVRALKQAGQSLKRASVLVSAVPVAVATQDLRVRALKQP